MDTVVELATALGNDQIMIQPFKIKLIINIIVEVVIWKAMKMFVLSIWQAGINTCVLSNTVDSNGKFKITTSSDNNFKTQTNIGTTRYDALELSVNTIDKTSILTVTNLDILQSVASKALASTVYTQKEITNCDIIYANELNNKADKNIS